MRISRMIKLLLLLLLIAVPGVSVLAQQPSQQGSSTSPSPVEKSAQALLDELDKPSACSADDTLCVAQFAARRLEAAKDGIRSLITIDRSQQVIVSTLNQMITQKDIIIGKYEKLDQNNQQIDANSLRNEVLFREQIADEKQQKADLQHRLDSCSGNQKWIALFSGIGGGFIGYKLHNVTTQFVNPFAPVSQQTLTEQQMKKALQSILK